MRVASHTVHAVQGLASAYDGKPAAEVLTAGYASVPLASARIGAGGPLSASAGPRLPRRVQRKS